MPKPNKMEIHDHYALGEIIKGWSRAPDTRPATVKEFKMQVLATIVDLGSGYKDGDAVAFFDLPETGTLSVVVPHVNDVNAPAPQTNWGLPNFYSSLAFNSAKPNVKPEDREKFKSCRIADYSTTKCM